MTTTRRATHEDARAIAAIYNEGIDGRGATFETRHQTAAGVLEWIERPRHPLLVVEEDGEVIAWAMTSPYSIREYYAGVAEASVFVAGAAQGRGLGTALLGDLVAAAAGAGFYKLIAKVFPENEASMSLMLRLGFREVGVHRRHGRLDGEWRDVALLELPLA